MKALIIALAVLTSGSAFAQTCGGRSGPCPSTVPAWDGHYAPGWEPGTPNANWGRQQTCGGQSGPCPSTGPAYTGCKEGRYSTFSYTDESAPRQGRGYQPTVTIRVVCHKNQWIPAN